MRIGFIGAGTVGTALAVTLSQQGYVVGAAGSRTLASAERLAEAVNDVAPRTCAAVNSLQRVADLSDLIFVTTPDDAIVDVTSRISWRPGHMVVHCSGALSGDALQMVTASGAIVGGFHPLQSFASIAEARQNIPGSTFGLEADGSLLAALEEMVERLGGRCVRLRAEDKVLYHAAAVMASNYTVALMKMATDLWLGFGVSRDDATQALMPLLQGTVNNIARIGLPGCLTGPIARGDHGTVEKHLKALEASAPQLVDAYREIGLQALEVAVAKGKVSSEQVNHLRLMLANGGNGRHYQGDGTSGNDHQCQERGSSRKEIECGSLSQQ